MLWGEELGELMDKPRPEYRPEIRTPRDLLRTTGDQDLWTS